MKVKSRGDFLTDGYDYGYDYDYTVVLKITKS